MKETLNLPPETQLDDIEMQKMMRNHAYWENKAETFQATSDVSWEDKLMMGLEVETVSGLLDAGSQVLDAGCSNGASTFDIAARSKSRIQAFDYSQRAIDIAKKQQAERDPQGNIAFSRGNILNIDASSNSFDAAYTIRVIINLNTWRLQQEAIRQIHRVLKPGGRYLMSEAFKGSLAKLNALRELGGLKALGEPDFNLYLQEDTLEGFVEPYFQIEAIRRFSSIYYVGSRFVRYLTMHPGDRDSFENAVNRYFAGFEETENAGDFGIQKLYVLRKR